MVLEMLLSWSKRSSSHVDTIEKPLLEDVKTQDSSENGTIQDDENLEREMEQKMDQECDIEMKEHTEAIEPQENVVQRKPGFLALLCCPFETMWLHEGQSFRKKIIAIPIFIFAVNLVYNINLMRISNEWEETRTELLRENEEEIIPELDYYFVVEVLYLSGAFVTALTIVLIMTWIYVLCIYKPGSKSSSPFPSLSSKLCCPVPTVYYWEGNRLNEKLCFACLFGFFYTVPYYKPSNLEQSNKAAPDLDNYNIAQNDRSYLPDNILYDLPGGSRGGGRSKLAFAFRSCTRKFFGGFTYADVAVEGIIVLPIPTSERS